MQLRACIHRSPAGPSRCATGDCCRCVELDRLVAFSFSPSHMERMEMNLLSRYGTTYNNVSSGSNKALVACVANAPAQ